MCMAIEEMMSDSRIEGRKEGRIEGAVEAYKEVGIPLQEAIQRVADKFQISLQQSEEETKKYW